MKPSPYFSPRSRQRGVSIIAAIFFLLLFAAISAAMVTLTTTSNATSTQDIQGGRAYQAARAGVEWGLWQVLNNPANGGAPASAADALPVCFASPTNIAAVPGFAISVTCTAVSTQEGAHNVGIYRIVSTATGAGPGGGVERQLAATAEVCRDTLSTVAPFGCLP